MKKNEETHALFQRIVQGRLDHAQGKTIPAEQVIADLNRRIEQDFGISFNDNGKDDDQDRWQPITRK